MNSTHAFTFLWTSWSVALSIAAVLIAVRPVLDGVDANRVCPHRRGFSNSADFA